MCPATRQQANSTYAVFTYSRHVLRNRCPQPRTSAIRNIDRQTHKTKHPSVANARLLTSSAATIASGRLRRFSAKLIAATLSTAKRANRCRAIDLISGTSAPSTRSLLPSRLPLQASATSVPHSLQRRLLALPPSLPRVLRHAVLRMRPAPRSNSDCANRKSAFGQPAPRPFAAFMLAFCPIANPTLPT